MVILSLILGKIKFFSFAFGGSVTLGRFVPLIFLSYNCGYKTGFFASLVCGIIHIVFSFNIPPAKNFSYFFALILLDYILPYLVFGLTSFFDLPLKNNSYLKMYTGTIISFILKIFICTISGAVLWVQYIPCVEEIWTYSLFYNCAYLIPECLISIFMISKLKRFFKFTNFELPA